MNLVVDIGNTATKAAIFCEGDLINQFRNISDEDIIHMCNLLGVQNRLISAQGKDITELRKELPKHFVLDRSIALPFYNKYDTPETLGTDRIALAAAASTKYPKQNVLVIDAGTCLTYDFINSENEYLGGAISPGLNIRYKSLHNFTRSLPLVEAYTTENNLIGKSTFESIKSGVLNGTTAEIEGIIHRYNQEYNNLVTVICGGDSNIFASIVKEGIFVMPEFLFYGLNSILEYNVQKND